jgi:hypothetical protein
MFEMFKQPVNAWVVATFFPNPSRRAGAKLALDPAFRTASDFKRFIRYKHVRPPKDTCPELVEVLRNRSRWCWVIILEFRKRTAPGSSVGA